jgi:hypothetical protein
MKLMSSRLLVPRGFGAVGGVLVAIAAITVLPSARGSDTMASDAGATQASAAAVRAVLAPGLQIGLTKGDRVTQRDEQTGKAHARVTERTASSQGHQKSQAPRVATSRSAAREKAAEPVISAPSDQSLEEVTAYWTPERMANAKPMERQVPGGEGPAAPPGTGSSMPGSAP